MQGPPRARYRLRLEEEDQTVKLHFPRYKRPPPTCKITDRAGKVIYKGLWFHQGKRIWSRMLAPSLAKWWKEGGGP